VERGGVDLGLQAATLGLFGRGFDTSQALAHLRERLAVAVRAGRPLRDVVEPVIAVREARHLGL